MPVAELCRKHGMSDAMFYNWKSKYGGPEVSKAVAVSGGGEREGEADTTLDNAALEDLLGKNGNDAAVFQFVHDA